MVGEVIMDVFVLYIHLYGQNYKDQTAAVTPNGDDCKGIPFQNALNSGLGIIEICPDLLICLKLSPYPPWN